jgi:ribose 5-phosphate isomerase B
LDPQDDYPPPCITAAARTVADEGSLGVVIGGSGNGEQNAANKVRGVRAALAWNDETARLAREHNNANVVSIGARQHPEADAVRFVEIFLATPFSEGERHARRIAMLAEYEATGAISGHQTT